MGESQLNKIQQSVPALNQHNRAFIYSAPSLWNSLLANIRKENIFFQINNILCNNYLMLFNFINLQIIYTTLLLIIHYNLNSAKTK